MLETDLYARVRFYAAGTSAVTMMRETDRTRSSAESASVVAVPLDLTDEHAGTVVAVTLETDGARSPATETLESAPGEIACSVRLGAAGDTRESR